MIGGDTIQLCLFKYCLRLVIWSVGESSSFVNLIELSSQEPKLRVGVIYSMTQLHCRLGTNQHLGKEFSGRYYSRWDHDH